MKELFQSSLFGYSKKNVCAYITSMNEDFSKKLLEKELEYQKTIQALQAELEQLQQENEALRSDRQEVAGALIDAKTFAAELMARAEAEDRVRRSKNEAYHLAERQRLQALSENIDALREAFRTALHSMDAEMERYGLRCQAVQAEGCTETPEAAEEALP